MNSENNRCVWPIISKRSSTARIGMLVFLALGLVLSGCHGASTVPVTTTPPPSPNPDWTLVAKFNFDFTNYVPCSTAVTKGCITGFTFGYSQSGSNVPLKTSTVSICTGATQPQTCTDTVNSVLGIGPTVFYVTANGIDNSGAAVTSATNSSSIDNVVLIPPTNIIVTRN